MAEEIVMYESDEAASYKHNLSGWVSRHGRFLGENEHLARYDGGTHRRCDCGNVMEIGWTKCHECREKRSYELYQSMPFQEWDGEPLVLRDHETYFFSDDDLYNYMVENELTVLDLIVCEPNTAPPIEEYADSLMPEDLYIDDIAPELASKIADLNQYIIEKKPVLSWASGKFRTTVSLPDSRK